MDKKEKEKLQQLEEYSQQYREIMNEEKKIFRKFEKENQALWDQLDDYRNLFELDNARWFLANSFIDPQGTDSVADFVKARNPSWYETMSETIKSQEDLITNKGAAFRKMKENFEIVTSHISELYTRREVAHNKMFESIEEAKGYLNESLNK